MKTALPLNFRDACCSLTSVTKCVPLSPEQEETMAGLEGVFKSRVSSPASLAHPRASQAAGQKVQSDFSGKLKTTTHQ